LDVYLLQVCWFLLVLPVYFSKLNGIIDTKKNEVMIENGSKQNQKKESPTVNRKRSAQWSLIKKRQSRKYIANKKIESAIVNKSISNQIQ
jgi:hypothetical protein